MEAPTLRELSVKRIEDTVYALFMSACCEIGEDVLSLLEKNLQTEESPFGREVLRQLIENDHLAAQRKMPICQDTGMAVVYAEVGQDAHIVGGLLEDAVNEGVKRGYTDGDLRKSVVMDPIRRGNTGDNTPAILHVKLVKGNQLKLTVSPKGFGSENMSRLCMLTPSQGLQGVKDFVIETARIAGANP